MMNLCSNFEGTISTYYEDTNGVAKCRICGCLGLLQFVGNSTIRQIACDFLL